MNLERREPPTKGHVGNVPAAEALERFASILEEEGAALRAMDAPRVLLAAEAKERCMAEALDAGLRDAPELGPRLAELQKLQQRNLRLLIHARDCVHDALTATGAIAPGYGRGKPTLPPGQAIDVRG